MQTASAFTESLLELNNALFSPREHKREPLPGLLHIVELLCC